MAWYGKSIRQSILVLVHQIKIPSVAVLAAQYATSLLTNPIPQTINQSIGYTGHL